jgi:succinate dehydrogenase / fumarate reductase cytochrome b subunit
MLRSTVTKKYVMAISGLALTGFVVMHLIGNLQLLIPGGAMFNAYAHHLESLGKLLWVIEAGLVAVFLVHIAFAIMTNRDSAKARPVDYAVTATKGGDSKNNLSSRNMLLLGVFIAAFAIFHVWHFKFGAMYETVLNPLHPEEKSRDLYKLVVEEFKKIHIVALYVGAMFFLLFHLRHGIWSAFQSIGAMPRKWSTPLYGILAILAVLLALGFMLLPIIIYLMPSSMLGVAL